MSIKALRKVQLGKEATAGTAVAATAVWRGVGLLEDTRETVFPDENIGYVSDLDRSYVPMLGGAIELGATELTFEQVMHVFEAGIQKVTTGSADGAGSGKVYTYLLPTTQACNMATPTRPIQSYTIEAGDDNEAEEMEYSFVESFNITGSPRQALMITSTWMGRQVAVSSFTTTAVLPTVEEVLFQKGALYIDAVGGTIGSTQKSNTLVGLTIDCTTGLQAVPTADGSLYFTFVKGVRPALTAEVTFEHDGTASAEKAAWRAQTPRQLRFLFSGSALTTSGTYSTKTFICDMAGKWESFSVLEDNDGNDIVRGTFKAAFDSTANLFGRFIVVNNVASIP